MDLSSDPEVIEIGCYCPFMDCEFFTLTNEPRDSEYIWKGHFICDHRRYFETNAMETVAPVFSARLPMPHASDRIHDPLSWQSNKYDLMNYLPWLANAAERPIRRWDAKWIALWLLRHGFSIEWCETIRTLKLEGDQFLKLGKKRSSLAGVGTLHTQVYPELARVCVKNGVLRPSNVQHGEGKRLQKLIAAVTVRDTFCLTYDTQAPTDVRPVYSRWDPSSSKLVQWAHDMPSSTTYPCYGGDPASTKGNSFTRYDPVSCGITYAGRAGYVPGSANVAYAQYNPPSVGGIYFGPTPPSVGGLASHALPKLSIDIAFPGSDSFGPEIKQTVNSATSGQRANNQEYPYPEPWLSGSPAFIRPHSVFPAVDGQGSSMQEKALWR